MIVQLRLCVFTLGLALASLAANAFAEPVRPSDIKSRTERLPKRLEGVDIAERTGALVPPALGFVDEHNKPVLYDQVVRGSLPTILTMNYSDCPMLCSLQLNALVDSMKQLDFTLGKDYRIVTVSLDPQDTPDRMLRMKSRYLAQYGRPEANDGWTFLSGSDANIHAVARALGFSYNYNEARDEYVHPAAFAIATPAGVVSRYLYGLEYHPRTLRLSLVEASEGKIGSTLDRLILYCFHYDETEGRYAPLAMNIMRLGGCITALSLGGLILLLRRGEKRPRGKAATLPGPLPS